MTTNDASLPDVAPIELSPADAAAIARLYDRCAGYFVMQDGVAPDRADVDDLFRDIPAEKQPGDHIVLGWPGNHGLAAVIALLRDYPHDGIWYLGLMLVDPALRGRGYGKSLYAMIEAGAAAGGAHEVRLAVLDVNEAGHRFWRSLGFQEHRRVGPDRFKTRVHHRTELRRRIVGRAISSQATMTPD